MKKILSHCLAQAESTDSPQDCLLNVSVLQLWASRLTAQPCNYGLRYAKTHHHLRSPTGSLRLSLREAHRASRLTAQPLIAPIMTPLLKYFWMKG